MPVISESGNAAWIAALPKVELHIHLEGAVPLRAQWEIASKYGHPESFEHFTDRFEYQDFEHFLDIWAWRNTFIIQTSLNQEYLTLMETFGFSRAEVLQVAQNAVTAAWASPTEKEHLATALTTAAAL